MSTNDNEIDIQQIPDITFPMLDYEKQIFVDIFEKDGLVIMAKYVILNVSTN